MVKNGLSRCWELKDCNHGEGASDVCPAVLSDDPCFAVPDRLCHVSVLNCQERVRMCLTCSVSRPARNDLKFNTLYQRMLVQQRKNAA